MSKELQLSYESVFYYHLDFFLLLSSFASSFIYHLEIIHEKIARGKETGVFSGALSHARK